MSHDKQKMLILRYRDIISNTRHLVNEIKKKRFSYVIHVTETTNSLNKELDILELELESIIKDLMELREYERTHQNRTRRTA